MRHPLAGEAYTALLINTSYSWDMTLERSALLAHYRAYFSQAYRDHRDRISAMRDDIDRRFGGDQLARFQRLLDQAGDLARFWADHLEVPSIDIDVDAIATVWAKARDKALDLLHRKAAAPLDPIAIDTESAAALADFDTQAARVGSVSDRLCALNPQLAAIREHAAQGSLSTAETRLSRLHATKNRFTPATDAACTEYLTAKAEKERLDQEKATARGALNEHREGVFGRHEAAINKYLDRFHADFALQRLEPSDAAGIASTTYCVVVNRTEVPLSPPASPGPSFKTALSAGDRNTLALAFFFACLQEAGSLADTVIVIDDPLSSLDDGRSHVTVQEVRKLVGPAKQLIVLSHSLPLLLHLWERCDKSTTATLEVRDMAPEESTIAPWDADAACATDYDRRHKAVRDFAENAGGDAREVAQDLRILLEGFLRVAFVEHMPPGRLLSSFLDRAKQLRSDGSPILSDEDLQELDDLRDYTNQFHHENPAWRENVSNVSARELRGYAKRVVAFTRIGRRTTRQES